MWGGALNKNSFRVRVRFRKNNDAMSQHQCWASHFHIARFRNNVPRKSGFQEKWWTGRMSQKRKSRWLVCLSLYCWIQVQGRHVDVNFPVSCWPSTLSIGNQWTHCSTGGNCFALKDSVAWRLQTCCNGIPEWTGSNHYEIEIPQNNRWKQPGAPGHDQLFDSIWPKHTCIRPQLVRRSPTASSSLILQVLKNHIYMGIMCPTSW